MDNLRKTKNVVQYTTMNGQDIQPFDFNEFSDNSKDELIKVIKELQTQWVANNYQPQFWFFGERTSDNSLSEQVIIKWLKILNTKKCIHYFKPSTLSNLFLQYFMANSDTLSPLSLDPGHNWDWHGYLNVSFFDDDINSPDDKECRAIAIDTLGNDINKLIELVKSKSIWGKFTQDRANRLLYDGVLLSEINSSKACKDVLIELLLADDHTLTSEQIDTIVSSDGTNEKRNTVTSKLRRNLRAISHDLQLDTAKEGHRVSSYKLVMK